MTSSNRLGWPLPLLILGAALCATGASWRISSAPAASESLETLRDSLVTSNNFQALGFQTPWEVQAASNGIPMPLYVVTLEQIKLKQWGLMSSRIRTGEVYSVIYPVMVGNEPRAGIWLESFDDEWEATAYGGANLIRHLVNARAKNALISQTAESQYFVVRFPAWNAYFVGYLSAKGVPLLAPALNCPYLNLQKGTNQPISKVFKALAPLASQHDGLPR